jgi:CDGSH-type Zn-finger protein
LTSANRSKGTGMADAQAKITPYRDGPYLVRGPFSIVDQDGNEIEVKRRVVALCRCGRSRMRPFCDGTHKTIGFRADSAPVVSGERAGVAGAQAPDGRRRVRETPSPVEDTAS